jgi:glycine cleavage system H protein
MSNPSNLKYTESHEWIRIDGETATIGITAHAAASLSDLVFLELPDVGDSVSSGDSFGEIESVKAVSDLKSPVNGEVTDSNHALEDDLKVINTDPYGNGWLIKVATSEIPEGLMDVGAYEQHIAAEA